MSEGKGKHFRSGMVNDTCARRFYIKHFIHYKKFTYRNVLYVPSIVGSLQPHARLAPLFIQRFSLIFPFSLTLFIPSDLRPRTRDITHSSHPSALLPFPSLPSLHIPLITAPPTPQTYQQQQPTQHPIPSQIKYCSNSVVVITDPHLHFHPHPAGLPPTSSGDSGGALRDLRDLRPSFGILIYIIYEEEVLGLLCSFGRKTPNYRTVLCTDAVAVVVVSINVCSIQALLLRYIERYLLNEQGKVTDVGVVEPRDPRSKVQGLMDDLEIRRLVV
ncbi:hypothetical protein BKA64DRAFT_682533 [Cadophora sp. MPI-SDFR-AT-0126]|nr:hypothetical protein BKA64DRAFT_682533 [Leotiomycetes sp. MPI-SDFR-AT-0126]